MDMDRPYETEEKVHDCIQNEEKKYKVLLDIIEKRDLFFQRDVGSIQNVGGAGIQGHPHKKTGNFLSCKGHFA